MRADSFRVPSRTRVLAGWLVLALSGLAMPAAAASHWLCGLSDDLTRLVCVADQDPVTQSDGVAAVTAVVRGTRFPLDPRTVYTVNFWSPVTERPFVEQLARATICYRSPGCEVTLVAPELEAVPAHRLGAAR